MFWKQKLLQITQKHVRNHHEGQCHPPKLQEEHKDPYVLDQDNNRIQQTFKNKSCSKWPKNMLGTIMEVIIILSYPLQLQKENKDPYSLDQERAKI